MPALATWSVKLFARRNKYAPFDLRYRSSSEKLKLHAAKAGGIYLIWPYWCSKKLKLHAAEAGGIFLTCGSSLLLHLHQRNVNQVFAQKPHLQFVRADHITHDQVISAVVTQLGSASRERP
jgi:hypothetical protein